MGRQPFVTQDEINGIVRKRIRMIRVIYPLSKALRGSEKHGVGVDPPRRPFRGYVGTFSGNIRGLGGLTKVISWDDYP